LETHSKIMITGGLGFIGSNLARYLVESGFENITILNKSDKKIKNVAGISDRVNIIIDDARNIGAYIEDIDVLFHLASTTDNYAIQDGEPHRDSDINVATTSHVLDAIRTKNPGVRLIYGSTFFTVGNPSKCPVDESVCCRPTGLYGATRLCGEHLTYAYRNAFELDAIVVRFTNVYGAFERSASSRKAAFNYFIMKSLRDETITMYGDGKVRRDYLYVSDAVRGLVRVAEKAVDDLYFIGSGQPRSIKEMLETIIEVVGKGRILPIETPDFHKKVGTRDFWIDNSKLSSLGWSAEVALEAGIRKTAEYYLETSDLLKISKSEST